MNNRHGLVKTGNPVVKRVAKCAELRLMPAGAETEDQSAAADLVDRVGHLGEQSRITESGAGDKHAELDPFGDSSERGQKRKSLPDTLGLRSLPAPLHDQVVAIARTSRQRVVVPLA